MRFTLELEEDWKSAWKWLQTQLGVLIAVAPMLYSNLEPIREVVPSWAYQTIVGLLGALVVLNALRKKPESSS